MADDASHPPGNLPEAILVPRRRRAPQLVWLVPLIALLIGAWLIVNALTSRGPTVIISFLTAEGIEPGKTRIRYKDVDIGEVRKVTLSPDRQHVQVTAQLENQIGREVPKDTRFWVVRPRVAGGKISGIGTLLSGAYLGLDIGKSPETASEFVGLEVAPVLTDGRPGRHFVLKTDDIGSLEVGSPVFFRRLPVGEIVAHELDADGKNISMQVFIHAPYDRYVTTRVRFWNASGVDISLDANGVRFLSQSLASVLLGGIAFGAVDDDQEDQPAADGVHFTLFPDRVQAMKAPDANPLVLTLNFWDSIRGLTPGAPVDFRGMVVGEVLSVGADYEPGREGFHFPVRISLYPERIRLRGPAAPSGQQERDAKTADLADSVRRGLLKAINERGLRAQLRSGNLLTGQKYVALDFFPGAKKLSLDWSKSPRNLPTVRGNFDELQVSLAKILAKIDKLPLEEIGGDLRKVLATLDQSVSSIDRLARRMEDDIGPEVNASLRELRTALASVERLLAADSPLQQEVRDAMREVGRAAQSFRVLSDTLEREPESLIRGKKGETR